MAKTKQKNSINSAIKSGGFRMASQDIGLWKRAVDAANNKRNPKRKLLYDLYDNIVIDGHLKGVLRKRSLAITNKKIYFKKADGNIDETVQSDIINKPWFYKMLKYAMQSIPYGHSLIELSADGGIVTDAILTPRKNVIPERNFLAFDENNPELGIYYNTDASYKDYLIEVQNDDDPLGLLMIVAQYVIYKRGGYGDWAQFAEIFGQPFRVGKYNLYDNDVRNKLEKSLDEMGSSPYAVIPEGAAIEFHSNNGSGKSETFENLIKICKEEISICVLGNTMTTEDGSSRSQSEVHQEAEDEITAADIINIQNLLNWQIIEKLRAIGYNIPDGEFVISTEKKMALKEILDVALKVSDKVLVSENYWYETFGIPKPSAQEIAAYKKSLEEKPTNEIEAVKKKITKAKRIGDIHNHFYNEAHNAYDVVFELSDDQEDELNAMFNGKEAKYFAGEMQKETEKLTKVIREKFPVNVGYLEPDYLAGTMMELNLNRFGFNKSFAKVLELNKALDISENYSTFKKKAFAILGEFDGHIKTEYNLAISVAQNARDWQTFKGQKNKYPYLQYKTVGDDAVRTEHQALHNKVFEIDKTDWRAIYPPNGYGCRCEMIQLRKDQVKEKYKDKDGVEKSRIKKGVKIATGSEAKGLLGKDWELMKKGGFDKNRGETNEIFDLNKTYLSTFDGDIDATIHALTYIDAGLESIAHIRANRKLKDLKKYKTTPEKILNNFEKNKLTINEVDYLIYKDYSGRKIGLNKKVLTEHLKGKYLNPSEERDLIFGNITSVLNSPDEVYLTVSKSNAAQYRFIKIFNDDVFVVDVALDKMGSLNINTWYKMKIDEMKLRSGIWIK